MGWKIGCAVATLTALVAVGYAYHKHRQTAVPAAAAGKEATKEATGLASLQVLKGSKAVAEASKEAQLGDVRAHDRSAEKKITKGG